MYRSTRSGIHVRPEDALVKGIAGDGGLFVPVSLDASKIQALLSSPDYVSTAHDVFKLFLGEGLVEASLEVIRKAYGKERFVPAPVTVSAFGEDVMMNLWHGPTFAFKDLALSILPGLMGAARTRLGNTRRTVVLTATSGDTGSATLDGFSRAQNTDVIVLYPSGGVSPFQERQMLSYQEKHAHVIAVEGDFDDCQRIVKEAFSTIRRDDVNLTSANSINIGRIVPQIVYHVWSYRNLLDRGLVAPGDPVDIVVPTGNFGNILSAWYARTLGVPLRTFVVASNENDVLTRFFKTGRYDACGPLVKTISPSMDILVSSNLERMLFEASGRDPVMVSRLMDDLAKNRFFECPQDLMDNLSMFKGVSVSEQETRMTIRKTFEDKGLVLDPHTAVAVRASEKHRASVFRSRPAIIASTATPYKFATAVLDALGEKTTGDPMTDILALKDMTGTDPDPRMLACLAHQNKPITVSKENALDLIGRLVGGHHV
jgi:threonine synthase